MKIVQIDFNYHFMVKIIIEILWISLMNCAQVQVEIIYLKKFKFG